MRLKWRSWNFVFILGMLFWGSETFGSETIKVYYFPFDAETYMPIMKADVVRIASEEWTVTSRQGQAQLLEILKDGSEDHFDGFKVRAKIIVNDKSYFIDSNGVVHGDEMTDVRISKSKFLAFGRSLSVDQRKVLIVIPGE